MTECMLSIHLTPLSGSAHAGGGTAIGAVRDQQRAALQRSRPWAGPSRLSATHSAHRRGPPSGHPAVVCAVPTHADRSEYTVAASTQCERDSMSLAEQPPFGFARAGGGACTPCRVAVAQSVPHTARLHVWYLVYSACAVRGLERDGAVRTPSMRGSASCTSKAGNNAPWTVDASATSTRNHLGLHALPAQSSAPRHRSTTAPSAVWLCGDPRARWDVTSVHRWVRWAGWEETAPSHPPLPPSPRLRRASHARCSPGAAA